MRHFSAALLLAIAFAGCCSRPATSDPQPSLTRTGDPKADAVGLVTVLRVIDGDTIEVELHGEVERVRLLCIDTPERGEPGFAEATDYLRSLIGGARVRLEKDPEHGHRDRFGRLLRYVWVASPESGVQSPGADAESLVQVLMIEAGHSKYATKWGASSLYDAEMRAAER